MDAAFVPNLLVNFRVTQGCRRRTRPRAIAEQGAAVEQRAKLKEQLLDLIQHARTRQGVRPNSPATPTALPKKWQTEITQTVENLEKLNPNPRPVANNPMLLDGTWRALYSEAREIVKLADLPGGLLAGEVFQVINVPRAQFSNLAMVYHKLDVIMGFVRVSATFEPRPLATGQRGEGSSINVQFLERSLHMLKIAGFDAPSFMDPFSTMDPNVGRIRVPYLITTYIDDTMRIGQSPSGMYLLEKIDKVDESLGIPSKWNPKASSDVGLIAPRFIK